MSESILSRLDPKTLDPNLSVKLVYQTFAALERWDGASSEDVAVEEIIKLARRQGRRFCKSLNQSILVAKAISSLCENIRTFCDHLLDEKTPGKDIIEYIQFLQDASSSGRGNAEYVTRKFRAIRSDLMQITNAIPSEVSRLESKQKAASIKKASHKKRRDASKLTNIISSAGAACVGAAIAIGLACPPGILILPIMLPVIALLGQGVEAHYNKKVVKRETEICQAKAAIAELIAVAEEITNLQSFIDKSVNFWTGMETDIKSFECSTQGLKTMRRNKILLGDIKEKAEIIAKKQLSYVDRIQTLQDYYPLSMNERLSIKKSNSSSISGGSSSKVRRITSSQPPTTTTIKKKKS